MLISLGVLISSAFTPSPYPIMFWAGLGAYILFSILASGFHKKHASKPLVFSAFAFILVYLVKVFFLIGSSISDQVMFSFVPCLVIFIIFRGITLGPPSEIEVTARIASKYMSKHRYPKRNVCHMIFELEDNTTREFYIDPRICSYLKEGDTGILTYKERNNSSTYINFIHAPVPFFESYNR